MNGYNISFKILVLFLSLHSAASAQDDVIGPGLQLPGHPRILMMQGEEQALKKTIAADETWSKMHQAILSECDDLINVAPVQRIQIGRRLLDKSREALRRL